MHVYSKGIICAHRTHCGRFLRVCLGAIRKALQKDTVAYTKGEKIHTEPLHSPYMARGKQSKVAPKRAGMPRYPCILSFPNAKHGVQNQKWSPWPPHPCLLGGPKEGGNATSPLHSWGSPTKGNTIRNKIRNGRLTLAFSEARNRAEMLRHPCILGDPNKGEQNQKWSPAKGNKISIGCLTPTFSGAQKRAEMLCHPCILGDPQQRGTKSKVVASPVPSRGPKRGQTCYATPAFSGVPNAKREGKIRSGHLGFLGYTRADTQKKNLCTFFSECQDTQKKF